MDPILFQSAISPLFLVSISSPSTPSLDLPCSCRLQRKKMPRNLLHRLRALSVLAFLITAIFLSRHTFSYVHNTSTVSKTAHNDTSSLAIHNHTVEPISQFPNHHNHYHHHHQFHFGRAALSEQFHCLVQKGADYWNQGVLPAFAGESRFPTPQFGGGGVDPLADSGWTSNEEKKEVPRWWKNAFKAMKGKAPKGASTRFIYLDQSQDFENAFGEQVGCTVLSD